MKSVILSILVTLVLAGCTTTKIQTVYKFEHINVPNSLYECQVLARKDLPQAPIKNEDVHALIENLIRKNGKCKANIQAVEKIIRDYNTAVEEFNKKKP